MASTVIGYFDDYNEAKKTEQELIQSGFGRNEVNIMAGQSSAAGGGAAAQGREPSAWEEFKSWLGLESDEDRLTYEEAARRGGTMVSVRAPDERADQAADIIARHHPVDLDRRVEEWRRTGWTGYMPGQQQTAERRGASQVQQHQPGRTERVEGERREAIPVIEEQLRVGKRAISRGGVRIHKHVTETPVQENVNLREEKVHVERRKVDRPVTERDQAFRERTIEARETGEEAVVQKQARVREEVELKKDVRQRQEQIRDTVRREDVDVERIEGSGPRQTGSTVAAGSGTDEDRIFREDFNSNYSSTGATYDHYRPAYEFGRDLALDARYRDRDWQDLETDARRAFESRNPNTWDRYGPAVRTGFMRTRSR